MYASTREGPDNVTEPGPERAPDRAHPTASRLTTGRLNLIRRDVRIANSNASWRPQFVCRLPVWTLREQLPIFTQSLQ
jgi:hypothetical protein